MTPHEHADLWCRDPRATPFQSPAWLDAWWTHLGGGERIDLEARDGEGRLIGALPAFIWADGGTRKLVPVGAGHSDYLDALIDPDQRPAAVAGLWRAAEAETDRWDEIFLPDLRADSSLLGALPSGWMALDEASDICPVLALPDDGDLMRALSKSHRRKVVHDRHRADRLGGVTVAFARPDELDEALDALFALHGSRWQAAGEPGVLADSRVQAFHRAAAPALAQAGLLRTILVRLAGRIVAVLHGFADRSRGFSYIIGIDHAVPGQSFGTLAFAALIDGAVADGAREFHFLRGEEVYKYRWGAVATTTVRRVIRRPTPHP
ncbi:MAG TPA: GNAT family N-acetyltransferase [Allosphingosinicella sp.]|jgi:CelD/BcsL family acetyltransferase involved in cellulose biosynthesis